MVRARNLKAKESEEAGVVSIADRAAGTSQILGDGAVGVAVIFRAACS